MKSTLNTESNKNEGTNAANLSPSPKVGNYVTPENFFYLPPPPVLDYELFSEGMHLAYPKANQINFPDHKISRENKVGRYNPDDFSDNKYWWTNKHFLYMKMEEGVTPADALNDLLNNPGNYEVECGTFCQIIYLAGVLHCLKDDAFNDYIIGLRESGMNYEKQEFVLRNQASTGVGIKSITEYEEADVMEEDLENADIGTISNISTTGLRNTPFANENIIKVGEDRFFAQGVTGKKPMSLKRIKRILNRKAAKEGARPKDRDAQLIQVQHLYLKVEKDFPDPSK